MPGLVPGIHTHRRAVMVSKDSFNVFIAVYMMAAIQREKTIKKYPRAWKTNLIERENPDWEELYPALVGMNRQKLRDT